MEVKHSRINFLTLLLLGIFIIFISALAYYLTLLIVRGEIGIQNVKTTSIARRQSLNVQTVRPITARIGILVSEYSRRNQEDDLRVSITTDRWSNFLAKNNIAFDTIQDSELEAENLKFDILLLPYNPNLSDQEIVQITDFLSQGGGLIAVGDCGARDETGEIRDVPFLNRVIGITKIDEIDQSIKEYVPLTLSSNSPLLVDVPIGAQVGLTTEYGCVRATVIEDRTIQDGYWYESNTDQGIPLEEIKNSTGLCHGTYGKGRFVWLGFSINFVTGDDFSQKTYPKIMRNAILWTNREALAEIKTWPLNYQCACLIAGDIEYQFTNVDNVLKILQEQRVNGVFFLIVSMALDNPNLVKAMAKVGEIAIHGDEHIAFKDQPFEVQLERLQKAKRALEKLCGQKITGFRPPFGFYDENTIRALHKVGMNYLCLSLEGGSHEEPSFIPYLDDFIIIPKSNKDDYDIFDRDSITDPSAVIGEFKDEFDPVYDLGCIYLLTYHSQILATSANCQILAELIKYIKTKNVWITTCNDLAVWWRKKRDLALLVEKKDSAHYVLTIINRGKSQVENFQIQLFPAILSQIVQVKSDFKEPLNWNFDSKAGCYDVSIKKLEPKTSKKITISFGP
jgi:peptidoglycan/xylan/chitin deacetylase (PgdA/CDA1 family)